MYSRAHLGPVLFVLALGCGGNLGPGGELDAGSDVSRGSGGGSSSSASGTSGTATAVGVGSTSGVTTTGAGGSVGAGGSTGSGGAGGTVDWNTCSGPGECTPQFKGCCESCGGADIGSFVGVNVKYLPQFRQDVCPNPAPCPPCVPPPHPFFAARCMNGRCEPFDIRTVPELSKCATDGDCRLRKGLDCCECGAPGEWTSVSIFGEGPLSAAMCRPMTGCAECAPIPPSNLKAVCTMNHCDLAMGN